MLTAEQIVDVGLPEDLDLGPDGQMCVYRLRPASKKDEKPVSALWICTIGSPKSARQFTSGAAEDRMPKWSHDGRQIAFLSDRDQRGTTQLYLIDARGGEAHPAMATPGKKPIEQFAWSPSGGHIAFTRADEPTPDEERREKERDDAHVYGERWPYARLRLLSLATGEVTTLVAGDRHITELAWSPHGSEIAYVVRHTPELASLGEEHRIERISVAGGEPKGVARMPRAVDSLVWTRDGQSLLFISSAAPYSQSSRAVYAVPADADPGAVEPRRIAFGEQSCALSLQQPLGASWAVVGEACDLDTRLHWLDPSTGRCEPLLVSDVVRDAEIQVWSVAAQDGGGSTVAMVASSGLEPPEVWMAHSEQFDPLDAPVKASFHQEALSGVQFGAQEPFYWTAPDGPALDGLLIRPPQSQRSASMGPSPMVVLVHGGPYGRIGKALNLSWSRWGQWLALAGYAVLLPNYRGGQGHGETFAAAARGAVGKADFGDILSAVDAAVERGIADPERLGIGGWSQGGFMAAWAVTQTNRFKAAVMGAGVSDWGMMTVTSDLPGFERELGSSAPWDGLGPHRHAELSPISFARNVTTPVLFLHGEQDARVPLSQAIGFHRALREIGVPCSLVTYPREPHGIAERAHQIDVLNRVRDWYDRWLRP
ncbi:MAG TPA: S9 family peptidase [Ktedonobacterales bacterium]